MSTRAGTRWGVQGARIDVGGPLDTARLPLVVCHVLPVAPSPPKNHSSDSRDTTGCVSRAYGSSLTRAKRSHQATHNAGSSHRVMVTSLVRAELPRLTPQTAAPTACDMPSALCQLSILQHRESTSPWPRDNGEQRRRMRSRRRTEFIPTVGGGSANTSVCGTVLYYRATGLRHVSSPARFFHASAGSTRRDAQ